MGPRCAGRGAGEGDREREMRRGSREGGGGAEERVTVPEWIETLRNGELVVMEPPARWPKVAADAQRLGSLLFRVQFIFCRTQHYIGASCLDLPPRNMGWRITTPTWAYSQSGPMTLLARLILLPRFFIKFHI